MSWCCFLLGQGIALGSDLERSADCVQAGPSEVNGLRLGYQCSLTASATYIYPYINTLNVPAKGDIAQ